MCFNDNMKKILYTWKKIGIELITKLHYREKKYKKKILTECNVR